MWVVHGWVSNHAPISQLLPSYLFNLGLILLVVENIYHTKEKKSTLSHTRLIIKAKT